MTNFKLLIWPDERLYIPSVPVEFTEDFTQNIDNILKEMSSIMIENNAIGLSAPQINIHLRFFILLINNNIMEFINPEIIETSKDVFELMEGCLSVPTYFEKKSRPNKIIVRYQTSNGSNKEAELYGIASFAFQHELDHLNGKIFIDDLSWFKKTRIKKKIKKNK